MTWGTLDGIEWVTFVNKKSVEEVSLLVADLGIAAMSCDSAKYRFHTVAFVAG